MVRTPRGPRRAQVLRREGSWVTMRDEVRLTLGPLGMAVRGVVGLEACVELLGAIVAARHRDAAGVNREFGVVIDAWRDRDAPAANESPTSGRVRRGRRSSGGA